VTVGGAIGIQGLYGVESTDPHEFPGGHNGNTTHPRAYAAALRAALNAL
jgi:hypothetical protein